MCGSLTPSLLSRTVFFPYDFRCIAGKLVIDANADLRIAKLSRISETLHGVIGRRSSPFFLKLFKIGKSICREDGKRKWTVARKPRLDFSRQYISKGFSLFSGSRGDRGVTRGRATIR